MLGKNLVVFFVGLIWTMLAACAPAGSVKPESEAVTEVAQPAANLPVIVLRRSGGFSGLKQEWLVFSDGRVEARQGNQPAEVNRVLAVEVEDLLKWMEANGFFAASIATPNSDEQCCDRFLYELSATYTGKTNTVVVLDTPENLPPDLLEAFRRTLELLGVTFS